jgi:hypothetical protein
MLLWDDQLLTGTASVSSCPGPWMFEVLSVVWHLVACLLYTHPAAANAAVAAGALQKVPVIPPADELATSALKRSLRVNAGAGIKNEAEKERSRAAKQLDTHMKVRHLPASCCL